MKTFYNICEYIAGMLFNILFIAIAVVAIYTVSTRCYQFGKSLFVEDLESLPYEEYTVTIPPDSDARAIGNILKEYGLIDNAWIFWLQSRLNGTYNLLKSGTYSLNTHMGVGDIMDTLQLAYYAPANDLVVTVPEGLTLRQTGDLLESKGLFKSDDFVEACANFDGSYYFLEDVPNRENRLEGYLFPDTYRLPENPTPEDLIVRMLNRFQEIFDYEMEERAAELNLSMDEIIIISSIIEKEIKVASERELCSSIIYNRLEQGMPLQMDSTVQYALDKRKDKLLESDLKVDSPYNTYEVSGLPYGPICSPGKASIVAALNPANTKYIYMVVSNEAKGEHYFTSDYDDFLRAKARYTGGS